MPELGFLADDRKARRVLLDDDGGELALGPVERRPLGEHEDDVGDIAVGDEELRPVEQIPAAVGGPERGAHGRGVGAAAGLGDGHGGEPAGGDAGQEPVLLLGRAELHQGADGVEGGGPRDGRGRAGPGDRLDQLQVSPVGHRSPAVLLGDEHAVHAEAVEELDVLPGELLGLVVLLGPGSDLLFGDLADVFDELGFGLVERCQMVESVEQCGHRRRPWAPSMVMVSPVRNRQSAVRTATTSRAISSAVPTRPTGMRRSSRARFSGSARYSSFRPVST